ncbi:Ig-like domain-containing protein, partial [Massilia eburnea]|uniref:Ig-like domain-containing protein n=1 Tax=Massilia eburnea TaxID=1776165 RepID=UPI00147937E6
VSVNASDNSGSAGINMSVYIDGVLKASGAGSSLSFSWNTRKASAGTHTIQAVAKDMAGNTSTTSVQVTR